MIKSKSSSSDSVSKKLDAFDKEVRKKFSDKVNVGLNKELVQVIPTGSLFLDIALGVGGWPRNRVSSLEGFSYTGKTTTALLAVAEAQRRGYTAAYIDTENALDPTWMGKLGVNVDALRVYNPESLETGGELAIKIAESGIFDFLVFDSVAGIAVEAETTGELTDSNMGKRGQVMSRFMRRFTAPVARNNMWALFTNQLRESLNPYDPLPKGPGGQGLPFAASIRVHLRSKPNAKSGPTGSNITATVPKNRLAMPHRVAEYTLHYDGTISLLDEVTSIMTDGDYVERLGIVKGGGGNYGIPQDFVPLQYREDVDEAGRVKIRGATAIQEMLASDTENLSYVAAQLRRRLIAHSDEGAYHNKDTVTVANTVSDEEYEDD